MLTFPISVTRSVLLATAFCMAGVVAGDEAAVDFNRDIRPLLSDRCFACHGPNENDRQGGLRLDVQESALDQGDSGLRAIVPGHPEKSEVFSRIGSHEEDVRMPPVDSNKSLTPAQIESVRRWIVTGAAWQEHWSWVPPQRSALPGVANQDWPRTEIDHFILARLEREDLTPSPEADRITLLRRVSFDLTGLPPSTDEVADFRNDKSPGSYERVVDRLLRSQRYGEHMARFWLDAARYGDTHGLHLDNYREIWPYRDWVVNAFNKNMPYDRFTIEQLAGDLLPDPTIEQLVATGFNRAHVTTNEGGSIEQEVYVRNVVDRVVTVGTVFMGMTLDCSRCHDHKFDPFSMDDFYSLFAFFNSIDGSPLDGNRRDHEPVILAPRADQQQRLEWYDQKIKAVEKKMQDPWPEIDALQREWEQELAATTLESEAGQQKTNAGPQPAVRLGSWYTVGPFRDTRGRLSGSIHGPEGKPVELDSEFRLSTGEVVRWLRRPEWTDGQIHLGLPGRLSASFLFRTISSEKARKLSVSIGSGDAIKVYLNQELVLSKKVRRSVAADQETVDLALQEGENQLLLKVANYSGESGFYFRLLSETEAFPRELLSITGTAVDQRSEQDQDALRDFYRYKSTSSKAWEKTHHRLAELRVARAKVYRQVPTTLVWRETQEPRAAHYLKRGEYDQPQHLVSRRTPLSLPPMRDDLKLNRLGFARWLTDRAHPLTARVAVNRLWLQVFGTGIVKTVEDFGSQGELPSHPKLLDWLALQFIEDGWDVKAAMKRMVMSATYRQSSRVASPPGEFRDEGSQTPSTGIPDLYAIDPENRLLARGPRFRLDAEMLRDQALWVSGLLVEKLGGPGVKPPQPGGLWSAVGYTASDTVRFVADQVPEKVHRRTLYTFIKRTAPPPQMSIVDAPSREACVMRRERTNTPLLSLMLFNDPQYVEAARALARRTMREGGASSRSRADFMFRTCACRPPTTVETKDLVQSFHEELAAYEVNSSAARELVDIGLTPEDTTLDISQLAAWTMVANMLLCTDEVVTKN
ncbi:MAG: hypothetical protein CMJ62_18500 [Planctomycetaceae bacterium]|nr:hypothetical protein [Planctomycetaceae bacterium]